MRFHTVSSLIAGVASGLAVVGFGLGGVQYWEAHSLRQEVSALRIHDREAGRLRHELALARVERAQLQRRFGELESSLASLQSSEAASAIRSGQPKRVRIFASSGQLVGLGWMQPSGEDEEAGGELLTSVVVDQTVQAEPPVQATGGAPSGFTTGGGYVWWSQSAPLWWVSGAVVGDGCDTSVRPGGTRPSEPERPTAPAPPPLAPQVSTLGQARSVGVNASQNWMQRALSRAKNPPPRFPVQPLTVTQNPPRSAVPTSVRTPPNNRFSAQNSAFPRNLPSAQSALTSPGLPAANRIR